MTDLRETAAWIVSAQRCRRSTRFLRDLNCPAHVAISLLLADVLGIVPSFYCCSRDAADEVAPARP